MVASLRAMVVIETGSNPSEIKGLWWIASRYQYTIEPPTQGKGYLNSKLPVVEGFLSITVILAVH